MSKTKAITAIKKVRDIEKKHWDKWRFCNEHKFTLEAEFHKKITDELREVIFVLQDEFDTGYVGAD